MSLSRRNPRRDANERAIIQAVRQVGGDVWQLSGTGVGDILVRYRGVLFCGEIKTDKGRLRSTQGAFPVWRTVDEVLAAIGAVKK